MLRTSGGKSRNFFEEGIHRRPVNHTFCVFEEGPIFVLRQNFPLTFYGMVKHEQIGLAYMIAHSKAQDKRDRTGQGFKHEQSAKFT